MLNSIEEVFSKVKLRARNILADSTIQLNLKDVIEISLANVTCTDCNNYYNHMYRQLPGAAADEPL